MSQQTRQEVLNRLRGRYARAGKKHKTKIVDQLIELFGYHRKGAIRALRIGARTPPTRLHIGRPRLYEPAKLLPPLKEIWLEAHQPCGKLLVAALPIWVPAYEAFHKRLPTDVREGLLGASAATLDRLLAPARARFGKGRCGTRPGTLLRQQIPIRGGLWEEDKAGFLELDTVALCGGSLDDLHAWMLNGVDIATTWVVARALENRGQAATLRQIQDIEKELPFPILGADTDNGGEFLNWHLLRYWTERERPVQVTRSRAYHKDDNAHIEQKNWTRIRQWFGYERYDNPEVVPRLNALCRGPWGQLLNYFLPTMKAQKKEREGSRLKRVYDTPRTPLARALESPQVPAATREKLQKEAGALNPFALRQAIEKELKAIERLRVLKSH